VNTAKLETMLAIADTILSNVVRPGLWNGLMIDVTCTGAYSILGRSEPVDISRLGYTSISALDSACRSVHRSFMKRLRDGSPSSYIIVGNCGAGGERDLANGWMRENFPWQNRSEETNEDGWTANMLKNGWGQPGYLMDEWEYVQPSMNWLVSNPGYGDSLSADNLRRHRLGLASATLGSGVHSFSRFEWDRHRYWWYPEYAVNQYGRATDNGYYKGWLGEALSTPGRTIEGAWRRDFKRGIVVVNPTSLPLTVQLGGAFRRIKSPIAPEYSGASGRTIALPARDAVFLLRMR
jgi:hypothetical protein